jgi:hypothetical protein
MSADAFLARAAAAALALASVHGTALAQFSIGDFQLIGANVQKRANGVLAMMGYLLTPDVTTGSLAISNDPTSNPDFSQTSLGGGFTTRSGRCISKGRPATAAMTLPSLQPAARRSGSFR